MVKGLTGIPSSSYSCLCHRKVRTLSAKKGKMAAGYTASPVQSFLNRFMMLYTFRSDTPYFTERNDTI